MTHLRTCLLQSSSVSGDPATSASGFMDAVLGMLNSFQDAIE